MLFVSNLAWEVSWQDLRDAFAAAGVPAEFCNVRTDREGQSRGFAIVAMPDADAAGRAVEVMDQREVGGRPVGVRRFNAEPPSGGGREYGGRDGGRDGGRRRQQWDE
jgi:RNA recognition motif-containing protein